MERLVEQYANDLYRRIAKYRRRHHPCTNCKRKATCKGMQVAAARIIPRCTVTCDRLSNWIYERFTQEGEMRVVRYLEADGNPQSGGGGG